MDGKFDELKSPLTRLYHVVDVIKDYVEDGEIYIPVVSNLTCTYKVSILGIFTSEQQVVQAIVKHFDLDLYRDNHYGHIVPRNMTTIGEIMDYMRYLFPRDRRYFFLDVIKKYNIRFLFNEYTHEYSIRIPLRFYQEELKREEYYPYPSEDEDYKNIDIDDSNTLYVLLGYERYIPRNAAIVRHNNPFVQSATGGTRNTRCLGLYTSEQQVVNDIIDRSFNRIHVYLAEEDEEYAYESRQGDYMEEEIIGLLKWYGLTLEDLNRLFSRHNMGLYVVQRYSVYIRNGWLPLPVDLTEETSIMIGKHQ